MGHRRKAWEHIGLLHGHGNTDEMMTVSQYIAFIFLHECPFASFTSFAWVHCKMTNSPGQLKAENSDCLTWHFRTSRMA